MSQQLDFWAPIEVLEHVKGETLQQRFERFHARNPHVYAALVAIARRMVKAGKSRIGIKQIYEVLRYERLIYTRSDDGHRLNNNFTSRYARLIIAQEADLSNVFETRELRAA